MAVLLRILRGPVRAAHHRKVRGHRTHPESSNSDVESITTTRLILSSAHPGHEVPFSSNRIVVHVSGPDITDLNFIDLPGSCIVS